MEQQLQICCMYVCNFSKREETKLVHFFFCFYQINASDSIEQMEIEINNTANVYKTPPYLYYLYENTFGSPYKSVYR